MLLQGSDWSFVFFHDENDVQAQPVQIMRHGPYAKRPEGFGIVQKALRTNATYFGLGCVGGP